MCKKKKKIIKKNRLNNCPIVKVVEASFFQISFISVSVSNTDNGFSSLRDCKILSNFFIEKLSFSIHKIIFFQLVTI